MRHFCSVVLLVVLTTVSVKSSCLVVDQNGTKLLAVYGTSLRRQVGKRSVEYRDCHGSDKIYINESVFANHGYYSRSCPNGQVFNEDMQCVREEWEANSGPWQTQHYVVEGRRLVIGIRRSAESIKVRSITLDN